jgi:probable rRNA maturation factor
MTRSLEGIDPALLRKLSVELVRSTRDWCLLKKVNEVSLKEYVRTLLYLVLDITKAISHFTRFKAVILLADDEKLKELNNKFRNKPNHTNVLSFPANSFKNGVLIDKDALNNKRIKNLFLGDIAISYQRIIEESEEQNKTFLEHFSHLLIHSFLHLLGFDHVKASEAIIMEKIEIAAMKKLNFSNPYA